MKNILNNKQKSKLKVAIGPVFDEYGGVSQHIFGIKKYSTHRVSEIPSKFNRKLLSKSGRIKAFYKRIMNITQLRYYDIIHSHVDPWFTTLCYQSRNENCKWVHTFHTFYFEEDYPEGLKIWQKEINKTMIDIASKADVKICISNWFQNYLYKNYSIETKVIPNGVDLAECDKASAGRFIKKYNLSDFILYIGNLQSVKNPKLFVELAQHMPKTKFVMIGRNLGKILIEKEYKVNIPKNLYLLGEFKREDVLDAISACKAFVMTSKHEGIPTVLLEAMALRKPVVVPNHSGCKEVVCNSDYGFLYEPDNLDDLIDKTMNAMDSKDVGGKARGRILKEYSWKIIARKIDSIYESCTYN